MASSSPGEEEEECEEPTQRAALDLFFRKLSPPAADDVGAGHRCPSPGGLA